MEFHDFLLTFLTILLAARLLGELAVRLHTPPVIGELLAGVLLGSSMLGWLEPEPVLKLLAELGIILLLFEVGLETDVMRLVRSGRSSLAVALTGVVLPFVSGYAASRYLFAQETLVSLFVGGALTATSIGITMRVLTDLGRQRGPETGIILGAAVIDDVIGVILLALLHDFAASGGVNLANTGEISLFIVLFMVLAPLLARLMAELIRRFAAQSQIPGFIPTAATMLILFFAWLAHAVGAPALLGGFAAGLALSQRFQLPFGSGHRHDPEFAHRIEGQMKPIIHLFTPIFFVMVGLQLDFGSIDWSSAFIWQFSTVILALAFASKLLAGFTLRAPLPMRLAVGLAMVPRGEVGLIFAELGRASGILNAQLYAAMVIVIALTTLLPPFLMKAFYARHAERIAQT
jgi:Kef-type K+ transport system membrane component KefB